MLLVCNWKMNPPTLAEGKEVCATLTHALAKTKSTKAIVLPPAIFMGMLASHYTSRSVAFGMQHIHAEHAGAFTGDISAAQAKDVGATHVLVGHAERRALGETDTDVRRKIDAVLAAGLVPILCIGESSRDQSGAYLEAIKTQLMTALTDVNKTQVKKVIVAYEPVWAIGAEKPMGSRDMHEMTIYIRKLLWEKYEKNARSVTIVYGGAVLDPEHAARMAEESEVDGFLFGRVSTDIEKLPLMVKALS